MMLLEENNNCELPLTKKEEQEDKEIEELAKKIRTENEKKMIATQNVPQRPNNAVKLMDPPVEDRSVDCASRLGKFGWHETDEGSIPYLIRSPDIQLVSKRMAEVKLLKGLHEFFSWDLLSCMQINLTPATATEAALLNDINKNHSDNCYGGEYFKEGDLLIVLSDLNEMISFLRYCCVVFEKQLEVNKLPCGFMQINQETVPYVFVNNKMYVPMFYFDGDIRLLEEKSVEVSGWNVAYIKLLCKVQGVRREFFEMASIKCVDIDDLKQFFDPGTLFRETWPCENKLIYRACGPPPSGTPMQNMNMPPQFPSQLVSTNLPPHLPSTVQAPKISPHRAPVVSLPHLPPTVNLPRSMSVNGQSQHPMPSITPHIQSTQSIPKVNQPQPSLTPSINTTQSAYTPDQPKTSRARRKSTNNNLHTQVNAAAPPAIGFSTHNQYRHRQSEQHRGPPNVSIQNQRPIHMVTNQNHCNKALPPYPYNGPVQGRPPVITTPSFENSSHPTSIRPNSCIDKYHLQRAVLTNDTALMECINNPQIEAGGIMVSIENVAKVYFNRPAHFVTMALSDLKMHIFRPSSDHFRIMRYRGYQGTYGMIAITELRRNLRKLQDFFK